MRCLGSGKPKLKGVNVKTAALVSVAAIALAGAATASAKPNPPGCRNPVPQTHNPNCSAGAATTAASSSSVPTSSGGGTVSKPTVGSSSAGATGAGLPGSGNTSSAAASGSSSSGDVVTADYSGGASHAYLCTKAGAMYITSVADVRDDLAGGSRYASEVLGRSGSQPNTKGTGYFTCNPPTGTRLPDVLADNNGWLYPAAMADYQTIGYPVYR